MGVDEDCRRQGQYYKVTDEEIEHYHPRFRSMHLKGVLSEEEVKELDKEYMAFLNREIKVEGRDLFDSSAEYTKPIEDFSIVSILLPSKYNPRLEGNIYEKRASFITQQLLGSGMVLDYDQLIAKTPNKSDGVFHWHQDLAYWPMTKDSMTASFWLAIDDRSVENGCLHFIQGNRE